MNSNWTQPTDIWSALLTSKIFLISCFPAAIFKSSVLFGQVKSYAVIFGRKASAEDLGFQWFVLIIIESFKIRVNVPTNCTSALAKKKK